MSETNKIMTSIQFPNTQEPYNINDARIPQNPDPYMQLVTDGEGQAKWEQRLAYSETKEAILVNNVRVSTESGFTSEHSLVDGNMYSVTWDGVLYNCVARNYDGYIMIGNNAIYNYDGGDTTDTGEPFAIEVFDTNGFVYTALSDSSEHILSISGIVESITHLDNKFVDFSDTLGRQKVGFGVCVEMSVDAALEVGKTTLGELSNLVSGGPLFRKIYYRESANGFSLYFVYDNQYMLDVDNEKAGVKLYCLPASYTRGGIVEFTVGFDGTGANSVATDIHMNVYDARMFISKNPNGFSSNFTYDEMNIAFYNRQFPLYSYTTNSENRQLICSGASMQGTEGELVYVYVDPFENTTYKIKVATDGTITEVTE